MNEILVLKELNDLNYLLNQYALIHPQHSDSIEFLKTKYDELKNALEKTTTGRKDIIEWAVFFAPRIIFEGINDKKILSVAEQIRKLLNESEH